jgi:nodulation protein E
MSIVITGTGVHCAAGITPEALRLSVADKIVPAQRLTFERGIEAIACPCPDPILTDHDRHITAKSDRITKLAMAAARQAWDAANLSERNISPNRIAVIAGTSRGPSERWNEAFTRLHSGRRMLPTLTTTSTLASLSGALSQALGTRGPCLTVSATCASAAHAIVTGAAYLQSGLADVVIAGGSDAPLNAFVVKQMHAAGLLATEACRPFHADRDGLVPGDGAGFLVLERDGSSQDSIAELSGFAIGTCDSGKAGVEEDGAALCEIIRRAMGNHPIRFINAHGTGTQANDAAEESAYAKVLPGIPYVSSKPFTGHCLGATPAIEAILCIEQLRESAGGCALSTSIGFWGQLAALVLRAN